MNKIINISTVTDYSGEPPVVTNSNPVETRVRASEPVITRYFYPLPCCDCCCNCCNCCCNCSN